MEVVALESRLLMCAEHNLPNFGDDIGFNSAIYGPVVASGGEIAAGTNPLTSVPALNSNLGAPVNIYLDFNGAASQAWGGYNVPATPAFSQDGDVTTFTDAELTAIQEIWARVSEAYAPFNVNVTTVDPGSYVDGQSLAVVIGGSSGWLGAAAGGVAYVGSFTNGLQNVVWVFSDNLAGGYAKYVADAAEHESGHAFGLQHQSAYSGATKTAEYRGGTSLVAPIMGSSYSAARSKWAYGQSAIGYTSYQDDMSIISNNTNGFGYRVDDHGDTIGLADVLDSSSANVSGSGVITKVSDIDVFAFYTEAGPVSFTVAGPQFGGLLDATLKLVDLNGNVIATADTASLGETVTANLAAGSYRLIVSSKGTYGDVGQYTITGTIVPNANFVSAPSNLTATKASGGVQLSWYDNSWNEDGFTIERSSDGGATWGTLDTAAADSYGYLDATASVGATYKYRLKATNGTDESAWSNVATLAVVPSMPGSLTATSISASRIDLSWADVAGETGYVIERGTDRIPFATLTTVGANVSSFSDTNLVAGTRYYYRIRAISSVGASGNTAAASAFTRPAQSNLTLTVLATNQITLSWRDVVGETGYRVERTADGTNWSVIGTRGANVLTFADAGLTANTIYSYRVVAYNTGGDGQAASATATTLLPAPTGLTTSGASASQINLTWTNQASETGYRVERSTDLRTWVIVTTVGADVTSYSNTGLVGGFAYAYRVRAVNAGGVSTPSASSTAWTMPLAPALVATPTADTQVSLAWTNVAGETNYILQRSADGSTNWTTVASPTVNVATYLASGLTGDTTYHYRVIAHNASGDSAASNVVSPRTLLPAPGGLTGASSSASQINLTWADSTGESGYRVDRSVDGRSWYVMATLGANVTSWSNTGLVAGYAYAYRVRAINAGGVSVGAAATTWTLPAAPGLVAAAASDTQINLAWTNVAGETNYVLQRSGDGSTNWTTVASPTVNVVAAQNTGLTADTRYYYRVIAHNTSGDSTPSAVVGGRTLVPTVANAVATGASATQINLSWDDSTGETGYWIERWNGKASVLIATVAADVHTYANAGLVAGTTYYYRVRAVNAGGASLMNTFAAATTIPLATTLTATATSTTAIRLNWTNVLGETGYKVERSADGTNWTTLTTTGADVLTYTNTGLTTDTPYYYRVTAFNASGNAAASAVRTTRTLMAAPSGLAASAPSATQVNLTWNDSTGETGYMVERSLNGGVTWTALAAVGANVTSYSNTGLVGGYGYAYRVRAQNAGGYSDAGTSATALTRPATAALAAAAASPTQMNLLWTNVAGETGYRVERSADGTNWSLLTNAAVNVVSSYQTGLTADTLYYYRVTPYNASGDGATTTVSRRTVLASPTGVAVTAVNPTTATVTWNNVTGETGYRIERWSGRSWAAVAVVAANVTTYTNTGLVKGTQYYFRVRAINAGGDSPEPAGILVTMPLTTPVRTTSPAIRATTAGLFQATNPIKDLLAA
jgi:titin